jgi:hypothetical protein
MLGLSSNQTKIPSGKVKKQSMTTAKPFFLLRASRATHIKVTIIAAAQSKIIAAEVISFIF